MTDYIPYDKVDTQEIFDKIEEIGDYMNELKKENKELKEKLAKMENNK